ncbi:MAG: cytochrome c [Alphaproteobacteria bacterium]|nr:MAG: cytochrome c [Alphaproteobacteria bacterium]
MHMRRTLAAALAAGLAVTALPAVSHADAIGDAIAARKADMQLRRHYLMVLGAMAQGKAPYDAEAARRAAASLEALLAIDRSRMWPEGSDSFSVDGTRAKPEIWDNLPDVGAKGKAFGAAVKELAAVADGGLDKLRPAVGKLAGACKACHEKYREPKQ